METNISGVILAGGKSNRMGYPKAFLSFKGKRVIDTILDVFHSLFEEILIVTENQNQFTEFKDVKIAEDLIRGYGPLGGIYTGLKSISKEKAFFIACDMPLLQRDLIERLLSASIDDYDCVVPISSQGAEPLHAVYSRKILPIIKDLIKGEDFSISQIFKRCKCKYIKVGKVEESSFLNINTPEELKRVNLYATK